MVLDTGRGNGVPNSARALEELVSTARQVGTAIESVIDGKAEAVRLALIVLLAEGHLLIEDVPGVGKTMLAKALARSIDGSVRRIQFTPDLLPSDITGVSAYNQERREFEFKPGPIFANIIVGDEINRASPKTQSAMLECMEERHVTVDSTTYQLDRPFMVIATQNPIEMEGTYPLPEAQRDRFTARISIGYPTAAAELEMLDTHGSSSPLDQLKPVATALDVRALIEAVRGVLVAGQVKEYIIALCAATRTAPELRLGASPRAALQLLRASRARAALDGRDYVIPDDIQALAGPVLAHRLLPTVRGARRAEAARPGGRPARRADAAAPSLRGRVMRGLLGALTVRGRSFVAAGAAAIACGLLIPEPDLVRIGALLLALPLLSAFGAGRARYRLSCVRTVSPARLPAGQTASLTIRLTNVSRLRTGLLLAEDTVPYALGSRPRFIFEGIGAGGSREYTYQLGSETRGRYTVGPLRVRVADSFGLVSITRAFTSASVLTITPRIIPLARPPIGGYWLGDSEHGRRSIAASGEDDVGAARLPHRRQPAAGALAVDRAVRRADGPPRGAVLAEHGVAVPRHAARLVLDVDVRARRDRGGVHRGAPGGRGVRRAAGDVGGRGAAAGVVPRHAARHPRRAAAVADRFPRRRRAGARHRRAARSSPCSGTFRRGRRGSWRRPGAAPRAGWRCSSRRAAPPT